MCSGWWHPTAPFPLHCEITNQASLAATSCRGITRNIELTVCPTSQCRWTRGTPAVRDGRGPARGRGPVPVLVVTQGRRGRMEGSSFGRPPMLPVTPVLRTLGFSLVIGRRTGVSIREPRTGVCPPSSPASVRAVTHLWHHTRGERHTGWDGPILSQGWRITLWFCAPYTLRRGTKPEWDGQRCAVPQSTLEVSPEWPRGGARGTE